MAVLSHTRRAELHEMAQSAGRITLCKVQDAPDHNNEPKPWVNLRYKYTVDAKVYYGSKVSFGVRREVSYLTSTYHRDDKVSVRYDPNDPSIAVLEVGMTTFEVVGNIGAGCILPALGLCTRWFGKRKRRKALIELGLLESKPGSDGASVSEPTKNPYLHEP